MSQKYLGGYLTDSTTFTLPPSGDPQFYYNTALLHGDGTSTLPFNSDASTNNFLVTINGDTKPNNFNPYQSGYYGMSDNSTGYLTTPSLTFSGSWTVEGWFNFSSVTGGTSVHVVSTAYSIPVFIGFNSGYLAFYLTGWVASSTTSASLLNAWNHIALVMNSGTATLYLNGVSVATQSGLSYTNTDTYIIGPYYQRHVAQYSNVRFSNIARYTTTFTPSTTPFTSDANTTLLACQANRFIDTSSNAYTLTVTNSPSITAGNPFLTPATTYGSGYFDGSGDYLNTTGVSASGTGDFTYEAWVYPTSLPGSYNIVFDHRTGGGHTAGMFMFMSSSGNLGIYNITQSTNTVTLNQWNYVTFVRSSGTLTYYINGVSGGSQSFTRNNTDTTFVINSANDSPGYHWPGYISNARYTKSAVYTAAFTPPTAPLTAITNTQLLTTQTNGPGNNNGFLDASPYSFPITRNGNTTQGTFSPFGSLWSNYFDGASYESISGGVTNSGTGDVCIECWINYSGTYADYNFIFDSRAGSPFTDGISIGVNITDGYFYFGQATQEILTSIVCQKSTWYHVCVTRQSGVFRLFINGVLGGTYSSSSNLSSTSNRIGWYYGSTTSYKWPGYISNFRATSGAVPTTYQTSSTTVGATIFTPPTTVLTTTSQGASGTSLLTCQSNRFIDNSANAFTITVTGSPSVQRFSPFNISTAYSPSVIGGSGYFDGSGDYLSVASNTAFNWGTGDGTMEWWFNAPSQSTNYPGLVGSADYSSSGSTNVRWDNTGYRGKLFIYINGGGDPILVNTSTLASNAWHHCAVVRASGVLYFYVDGVQSGSVAWTGTMNWSAGGFYVGKGFDVDGAQANFIGYISNVRNVKGTAVYTGSTYTVPTAPLTATTNTALLCNFTNAAIYDNAEMSVLETVGNAQISTSVYKYGTGSMYFDGSGDYLIAPSSPNLGIGNVFTVECWLYLTAAPTSSNAMYVTDFRGGSTNNYAFGVINSSSNTILYAFCGSGGGEVRGSTNITTNTWYHLAYVNTGSTLTGYLNGVSQGTLAVSFNQAATNVVIGARYTGSTEYVTGYIDDLRITKGYARYTSNFTPPTAAFPDRYGTTTGSILPTATAAPGIWTMEQQAYYKQQGLWPTPPPPTPPTVTYLAVAGGGGGGRESFASGVGGGGGAGGLLTSTFTAAYGTTYTVTVGAGGALVSSGSVGNNGTASSISGTGLTTISATGGGGGGGGSSTGNAGVGNGGSGGGACTISAATGGTGISGQGYAGGNFIPYGGAGGGGAGAVGQDVYPVWNAGNGGVGLASSITGTSVYYAGGGGGAGYSGNHIGSGGNGGGGAGAEYGVSNGTAGTANTGGGGGGGGNPGGGPNDSGAGGSGVVIISSPIAAASTTGSPTVTTSSGNTIYTFTSSGTITF
jgi:hypothetical protein